MFFRDPPPPPPQLSYGKPFDFYADVPLFPPMVLPVTMLASRLLWKLSGKRLSYHSLPMWLRVAVLAIGLGISKFVVLDGAGGELKNAGSGTLFTPVEGLAT